MLNDINCIAEKEWFTLKLKSDSFIMKLNKKVKEKEKDIYYAMLGADLGLILLIMLKIEPSLINLN
ncbi:hypothetical protein JCM17039_00280 [Blautia glucerasea]